VLKECGGIAGVATYPEARRMGYVRRLMQAVFKQMYERGQVVSMLDPFKASFYAKFGYVNAVAPYLVEAPLERLLHSQGGATGKGWTVERLRAVDAQEEYLAFLRAVGPAQYHGYLVFKAITAGMWKQRVKDSLVVLVKQKGRIQAASRYRIKGERVKGRWQATLTAIDILWRSRDAREQLFAFFSKHQDQIHQIVFHAPFDPQVEHWFSDTRLKVERKTPWMVRIIDARGALENLPSAGDDTITIELADRDCPWNAGVFALQCRSGKLRLKKGSGKPAVKASIEGLTALVYGTQPLEELEFHNQLSIAEESARNALKRWFPPLPLYNVLYF
jgi:predicted acetyltransferase